MSTLYGVSPKYTELQLKILKAESTASYLAQRAIVQITDNENPTLEAHFVRDMAREIMEALKKIRMEHK